MRPGTKEWNRLNLTLTRTLRSRNDSLMRGNMQELWEKVKSAVESGNTKDFENYVNSAVNKAK